LTLSPAASAAGGGATSAAVAADSVYQGMEVKLRF